MPDPIMLPIFPLPVVIYPNEELRLHIFEPRYKELIEDSQKQGIVFTIMPVIENMVMEYGTLVSLVEVTKNYPDGKSDVRLLSLRKMKMIKLLNHFPNKKYSGALMEEIEDHLETSNNTLLKTIETLFQTLCSVNKVQPYRSINWDRFTSYDLGHYVGFNLKQEYQFFCNFSENHRLELLVKQLERMIEQSQTRSHWLEQMHMNGEFRQYNPEEWR